MPANVFDGENLKDDIKMIAELRQKERIMKLIQILEMKEKVLVKGDLTINQKHYQDQLKVIKLIIY